METKDLDIVYVLKESKENEEIRYSLRSLKNLPHGKVWIFGYIPKWVKNVEERPMSQKGSNKWEKTADSMWAIVNEKELSENFILFNDDFFVITPQKELPYYYDRTLNDRVGDFFRKRMVSSYMVRLLKAEDALKNAGKETKNYELHLPMIFNKEKFKKLWELYPGIGAKRTLYGNEYNVGGKQRQDVKIYQTYGGINRRLDYISTADNSFKVGEAGRQIRRLFPDKCEYEK